ncbi:MAG: hypothetical protein JOZ27_04295, partial [Caulobacteraceae bacterium]|nr:hypothetical protein [Caulobacteraceae bacterium]
MKRFLALGLAAVTLAACETPTYYVAAVRPGAVGFHDDKIEDGRYRITFQGGAG